MSGAEQAAITGLTEEVRGLRADIRVLHTKMFGSDTTESDQGRIPRIEAALASYRKRIEKFEHMKWAWRGIAWASGVIVGFLVAIYHFLGIVRH